MTTAIRAPRKRPTPRAKVVPIDPGVITLDDVKAEKIKWLWNGYLPEGKLVLIDGDPSTGKSTLCMDLAARISAGLDWPDGTKGIKAADVILLTGEDGLADTVAPRLRAAGGNAKRVHVLNEVTIEGHKQQPSLPRDIAKLEATINKHKAKLVVIDVLMAFLGANATNDQAVRSAMSPLKDLAERTGCTIIMLRHVIKSGGKNKLYRGSGSIGIVGAARVAYFLYRDPSDEDRRILTTTKSNISKEALARAYRLVDDPEGSEVAVIEWEPEPVYDEDALQPESKAERNEAVEFLTGLLEGQGGRMSRVEIMQHCAAAGFSQATMKRAKDKVGISHRSEGFPRVTYWSLP